MPPQDRIGPISPDHDYLLLPDEVHQATGIISAQLAVTVTDAFTTLRAYSLAHHEDIAGVADQICEHMFRFDRTEN